MKGRCGDVVVDFLLFVNLNYVGIFFSVTFLNEFKFFK